MGPPTPTQDIPCAAVLSDAMIEGDYEYETGTQIFGCFEQKNLSHQEMEMVLLKNHGPFTWGKTAEKSVYNTAVLEEVAKMAMLMLQINPVTPRIKDTLRLKLTSANTVKTSTMGKDAKK